MNCASCNVELKPVFADLITERSIQYDNALGIQFHSGYSMFFDDLDFLDNPYFESEQTLVICHDCAHKLVAENPWMRFVVDDVDGHTHEGKCHDAEHSHP